MLSIAESHGIKTHKRDDYFASSEKTNSEFQNLAKTIDAEYIMYSPLRVL